jgi:D-glycero-D-manno-heptose 1,7-bisphosphate phosphatase
MNRAVILDRDGTIIVDKVYLNDISKIEYMPGALEGLREMRDLGFRLIVATNQSGVARGLVAIETLYAIHEKIRGDLAREGISIEGFYYAPHSVESHHSMRKPKPGMLLAAASDFGLDLRQCYMIGDRDTDVLAGQAAGTKTIYLNHTFPQPEGLSPDFSCPDLLTAALWIRSQK